MAGRRESRLRVEFDRLEAARRSARAKTAEVLRREPSELSDRALLQSHRAARAAIEKALGKRHGASDARAIALHLSEWFEEAAFLVALHFNPHRFSKIEIEAGVSDVLAYVLDHMWEAARVAGGPLPCLEDETIERDDDEDP